VSTAVLNVPAVSPAPAFGLAPAAARLVVRTAFGLVLLAFAAVAVGPRVFHFQTFYVRSGSMSPEIPVGALVVAVPASAEDLSPGDVVIFQRPDQAGTKVVHRIHAVEQRASGRVFITKGDANTTPDPWEVPASGRGWQVVHSISRAGFVVGWVHAALSRQGWFGVLVIAAALCALIAIWRAEEPK
jgi:signal peptidase I